MVGRVETGVNLGSDPADLAGRIARGDAAAETELVERFRPALLVMLRQRLRHPWLAEDACQEALRIAIENLRAGALRDPTRLVGYLLGIAANVARKERRQSGRSQPADTLADRSAGDSWSPDSPLLARERSRVIRQVLSEMSDRDRKLLTEFYLHDRDKPDVCRQLGLSPDQFDVVKFRALRRFARLWSERRAGA